MTNTIISLNDHDISRLEQVIIDHDDKGAWELLAEIRKKVKATKETKCGVEKLRNLDNE
jgi:hypothetical protein